MHSLDQKLDGYKFFKSLMNLKLKLLSLDLNKHFHNFLEINEVHTLVGDTIRLADQVKYLGVHLDKHLDLKTHVNKVTSHCYILLRNFANIRRFLSRSRCEILARMQ